MEKEHASGEEEKVQNKAIHPSMELHARHAISLFFVCYLVCSWVIFEWAVPMHLQMAILGVISKDPYLGPALLKLPCSFKDTPDKLRLASLMCATLGEVKNAEQITRKQSIVPSTDIPFFRIERSHCMQGHALEGSYKTGLLIRVSPLLRTMWYYDLTIHVVGIYVWMHDH